MMLSSWDRVAGLGRLSAGVKMAMKPFVKRVFTISATNASFLPKKALFMPKDLQKKCVNRDKS